MTQTYFEDVRLLFASSEERLQKNKINYPHTDYE